MNKLKYLLILLCMCCLAGCFDIDEEITIHDDGSGTYTCKMDLARLLEMMQNFGGEEALTRDGLDKPIDTTILLQNIMPRVTDTAVPKQLWKNGEMVIHVNAPARILNTNTSVPFHRPGDLAQLMTSSGIAPGISEAFGGLFGKHDSTSTKHSTGGAPRADLTQLGRIFDITVTDGLISKKINREKYKELIQSEGAQHAREMMQKGMEIAYTAVIRLPRPAKKISNPLLQLSNDKKTVTATFNLPDLFDKPDKFSYTIEY